jgi:hypothetical protein
VRVGSLSKADAQDAETTNALVSDSAQDQADLFF